MYSITGIPLFFITLAANVSLGGFWLHGGVKDIRCQYGMTSDGTGFTASCDGYDESVLPVDQVLNVNDEGLLTCFEHVGTPMGKDWKPQYRLQTGPGPVIYTPASKAVSPRDISPNATMSGALGPTGTALNSGCPQRAFKPPGWDERVCNATEPGINAGESSMAIRIGSLMVLLALGVFLI
ncbi:hypothetical protein F4778DRAFT_767549 [Xylariomycetidae sp. FL2044]|nr:hypothetical protein F4778DRAFT_767549 [Xylariomycetidae sp. FL2044]